jgi:sulfotransferase family protein
VPAFEKHWIVAVRGAKAFLNLKAGVTRAGVASEPFRAGQNPELERSKEGTGVGNLSPENMVWIFGTGRSGNTWLTAMLESAGHAVWKEPAIGKLFGDFYHSSRKSQRRNAKFVLGDPRRDVWLGSIRRFVLEGASGRFPELSEADYLVVKEQVGSVGAPLLTEALPESRMIFLIRDPRDVVASWLDGASKSGWHNEGVARKVPERAPRADENPTTYVKQQSRHYLKQVGYAAEAYEAHQGLKVLLRYEELRADTLEEMRRIHSVLGMEVDEARLEQAVYEHSWENIPEEEKGEGKFRRKATPGSWREDLTPEQTRMVEEITAPLMKRFYPS